MSAEPVAPPTGDPPGKPPQHRRCAQCSGRFPLAMRFCPTDGTPLELADGSPDDRTGELIADRYRLVRLLGQGGMGQVYEAAHVHIDKRVALKLLRRDVVAANPEIIDRFRQEARAASSIGHPAIVEIDDFAPLPDGSVYLAMELLEGCSLAEHLRAHGPPSVAEAVRILIETARGLEAAHAAGIVHRDIKPENLFLCANRRGPPRVKILDFGIAKVSREGPQGLTHTGEVFGTPHYMSPEQALGKAIDARSDVYALGIIGYQLLAGHVPFRADSLLGVLNLHVQAAPPSLLEVAGERVPPPLVAAIERALAKDPAVRPQSMGALVSLLQAAMAPPDEVTGRNARSLPVVVGTLPPRNLTAAEAFAPPPEDAAALAPARNRRAPILIVGVLVAAVGIVLGVLAVTRRAPPPPTILQVPSPTPAVETKIVETKTPVIETKTPVVETKTPVVETKMKAPRSPKAPRPRPPKDEVVDPYADVPTPKPR